MNNLLIRMLKEGFGVYLSEYMKIDSRYCFYLTLIYNSKNINILATNNLQIFDY